MTRPPQKPNKRLTRIHRAIAEGAPALLTDTDFVMRSPRAKPRQHEKKDVQQPLVVYLRKHLPAGSIVHAQAIQPFNENHRFAMQRDGVQFGFPDLLILIPGGVRYSRHTGFPTDAPLIFAIECKAPDGGRLSDAQKHTQALLKAMGCEVMEECRSVEEGVAWLKSQGVVFVDRF